jgi:hypothetical protein
VKKNEERRKKKNEERRKKKEERRKKKEERRRKASMTDETQGLFYFKWCVYVSLCF